MFLKTSWNEILCKQNRWYFLAYFTYCFLNVQHELYLKMDALREVKEWLFNKFQSMSVHNGVENVNFRGITALTPQNIPEFVIPGGSEHSSRRTSSECFSEQDFPIKRNSYGGRSYNGSPPGSPRCLSPSESAPCIHSMKGVHCSSAPVTPRHEVRTIVGCRAVRSNPGLDHVPDGTNDDPLSFAAISLPHFRVKTSYGFTTLTENPHTRRKESLFHACNESIRQSRCIHTTVRQNSLNKIQNYSSPKLKSLSRSASCISDNPASKSMPSVVVTAARQNSRTRTPSPDLENVGDLTHRRLSPTYHIYGTDGILKSPQHRHNRYYNRRRSSLVTHENGIDLESSSASGNSTPSFSSRESVNEPQRHSLGELDVPPPTSPTLKRHSAPSITTEDKHKLVENAKPRSSSCHVIINDKKDYKITNQAHMFAPFGELKFSFQYLAASKQLKVTLIKAENLGGYQKTDKQVNAYAKAFLMPGKVQKQTTAVIKKTKNPVFNQDIFFHNINLEEVHSMSLVIRLFSKTANFKCHEFIGGLQIPLENYDVTVENRIWKDLESHKDREDLGYLSVGLKFDPGHGVLTVYIEQARQLPIHPITGSPNPYIRLEVSQEDRTTIKDRTTMTKNTANPCFEQAFTFEISPSTDNMQKTSVSLLVYNNDRFRSDVLIGQVILGCLATEVGQYGHWQEMLENPNLMVSKWHYLIDIDD